MKTGTLLSAILLSMALSATISAGHSDGKPDYVISGGSSGDTTEVISGSDTIKHKPSVPESIIREVPVKIHLDGQKNHVRGAAWDGAMKHPDEPAGEDFKPSPRTNALL